RRTMCRRMTYGLACLFLMANWVSAGGAQVNGKIARVDEKRELFILRVGTKERPVLFKEVKFQLPEGKKAELVKQNNVWHFRIENEKPRPLSLVLRSGQPVILFLGPDGKTLQTRIIRLPNTP